MLLRYPLTTELLLVASKIWPRPFKSRSRASSELCDMIRDGYVGREPIPSTRAGQKTYLYFLRPKARLIVNDVAHASKKSALFRGFSEWSREHQLQSARFCVHLERSAAEAGVEILAVRRPSHFRVTVTVQTRLRTMRTQLVPDYTFAIRVGDRHELLFLELANRTASVLPVRDKSGRSFRFKLAKYKTLAGTFRQHQGVREMDLQLGCKFQSYRVLVVSTGGEAARRALMAANEDASFAPLFLFTTMDTSTRHNIFRDKIWRLSDGKRARILPG